MVKERERLQRLHKFRQRILVFAITNTKRGGLGGGWKGERKVDFLKITNEMIIAINIIYH